MNLFKKITPLLLLVFLSACDSEEDASRIVIGDSNIIHDLNELQYQWPFVIQVSDVDGNPAPSTYVTLTVKTIFYGVGEYYVSSDGWALNFLDPASTNPFSVYCRAEDLNNNAVLDTGEDVNGSGSLEPTNSSTIAAHPDLVPTLVAGSNILITDEFGFGYFSLTYPKSEGNWSSFKITAEANVSGTENTAILEGILPTSREDLSDTTILPPGGTDSAYGLTESGCVRYE
jgi:hypothetical protein